MSSTEQTFLSFHSSIYIHSKFILHEQILFIHFKTLQEVLEENYRDSPL